jgi:antitoxin ParD1/3/4
MNVWLTPELEKLVAAKVASGHYGSASEVVRAALRLLAEQDHLQGLRRSELKRAVARGLADARKGRLVDGRVVAKELRTRFAARKRGRCA